ncbi:MAG: TRAP transporter substrate-binding protein DctP [Oscillospiraceae bacterium]|nr:TRAP transporter substrate-binding protein DctP [Oscillospiraceae bacterium]
MACSMLLALAGCGNSSSSSSGSSEESSTTSEAAEESTASSESTESEESEETESGDAEATAEYADVESLSILFSSTFEETETGGQIIAHFAEYLEEITGGQITVNVKYGGSLYTSSDELDAVSNGAVQMVALGHNPHADMLPYLCVFPDFAPGSTQNALDYFNYVLFENEESASILEAEATANGIKYLNVIAGGANVFISKNEFTDLTSMIENSSSFGNMAGAKFEYMGFTVTEMLPSDMYDSFDRGLVDTTQMGFAPCVSMGIYEVAQYWMLDNTYTAGNFFTVNLEWWESLSEEQQAAIQAAADEVEAYSAGLYDEAIESDIATVEAGGGTFIEMNDADTATWWDAVFVSAVDAADLTDENNQTILQAAADFTDYDVSGMW